MKGTIINQQNFVLTIASAQGIYQAQTTDDTPKLGLEAEFEALSAPGPIKAGQAKLLNTSEYRFDQEGFMVSKSHKVEGYRIMDCPEDPYVAAEGGSLEQAFAELKILAEKYQANALLNLQAQFKVNRLCGKCLFKLSARAAYLVPEQEIAETRKVSLPLRLARSNSPNRAQQRYLKVLCICALFIFCPILLKMWGTGQISLALFGLAIGALCTLTGVVFVCYFPTTARSYLVRASKRLVI